MTLRTLKAERLGELDGDALWDEELIEKGIERGQRVAILEALEVRFGAMPEGLPEAVGSAIGQERLRTLHRTAITAATLEEFVGNL